MGSYGSDKLLDPDETISQRLDVLEEELGVTIILIEADTAQYHVEVFLSHILRQGLGFSLFDDDVC